MKLSQSSAALHASPLDMGFAGQDIAIAPVTLARARACLQMQPRAETPETASERLDRLTRQAHAVLGPEHVSLTARFTMREVAAVVGALFFTSAGMPAERCALWRHGGDVPGTAGNDLDLLEKSIGYTVEFAAALHLLPAEAEPLTLADAINLHGELARQATAGIHRN